ncbi:hypothetical protein HDU87_008764 [Geranomyces variabilis]|uniref:Uncharacterized protein n=1 Tax=Geranomyces variabilis TaxID=109894 RepID=A0AAD5TEY8_9FUNG|nr:hypothetical protein HDU87_008764 [Geranomyces variabilis]
MAAQTETAVVPNATTSAAFTTRYYHNPAQDCSDAEIRRLWASACTLGESSVTRAASAAEIFETVPAFSIMQDRNGKVSPDREVFRNRFILEGIQNGRTVAMITGYHLEHPTYGTIIATGLIMVSPSVQGSGFLYAYIEWFYQWFAHTGNKDVIVVSATMRPRAIAVAMGHTRENHYTACKHQPEPWHIDCAKFYLEAYNKGRTHAPAGLAVFEEQDFSYRNYWPEVARTSRDRLAAQHHDPNINAMFENLDCLNKGDMAVMVGKISLKKIEAMKWGLFKTKSRSNSNPKL